MSSAAVPRPLAAEASPRFEGIQALRLVAALLVVITHATFYTAERLDPSFPVWRMGAAGVDIFFVISGFVMMVSSRSLIGKASGAREFAVRRVIRIVPMYWLATIVKIAVMVVIPGAALHASLTTETVVRSFLFLPSYNADGNIEPLLGVGWTLIFEMFFYALFALGLLIRVSPLIFAGVILVGCAIASVFRTDDWSVWAFYLDPIVLYFVIGMLIAKVSLTPSLRRFVPLALLTIAAVLAVLVVIPGMLTWAQDSLFRMLAITLLVWSVVAMEPFLASRLPKLLLLLGAASYSLYLFHSLIAPAVPTALAFLGIANPILSVILCIAVPVVASVLIYRFVEVPITKALLGWWRRRKAAANPKPATTGPAE